MMRTAARAALAIGAALFFSGCQTIGPSGLVANSVGVDLTKDAARTIMDDMVGQLAEHAGPGTTTIALDSDGSVVADALEESLRQSGYAVVTASGKDANDGVPIAYVVDRFEGSVLARVSTPTLDLTRLYRTDRAGASPSPLSVMQRGAEPVS